MKTTKKATVKKPTAKKPAKGIKFDDRPIDYTKYIREYERQRKGK